MPNANPSNTDIVALETSYWEAMKSKDGASSAALSGVTTLVTGAQGVSSIDKARMGKMTEEGDWTLEFFKFEDIEVITPTPDIAIIAYTVIQNVTMKGKSQQLRAADSSTWVRSASGWQCHAHSETLLKDVA